MEDLVKVLANKVIDSLYTNNNNLTSKIEWLQ